jgi:hypothetical protein
MIPTAVSGPMTAPTVTLASVLPELPPDAAPAGERLLLLCGDPDTVVDESTATVLVRWSGSVTDSGEEAVSVGL